MVRARLLTLLWLAIIVVAIIVPALALASAWTPDRTARLRAAHGRSGAASIEVRRALQACEGSSGSTEPPPRR